MQLNKQELEVLEKLFEKKFKTRFRFNLIWYRDKKGNTIFKPINKTKQLPNQVDEVLWRGFVACGLLAKKHGAKWR